MGTARRLFGLGLAAALSGCVVGPTYHTPPAPEVAQYTAEPLGEGTATANAPGGTAERYVLGADVPGQWWTVYHSPALNALVERALAANPDLKSAQAALRVAREAYYSQRAQAWPTVDASYQYQRQKLSNSLAPILNSNSELFDLHTAQVTVSYAPDVFGGVARQTESVRAQAQAQRFQTEATYLTLTSNLVVAAIQYAALADQIEATQAILRADRGVLDMMRRQAVAGEIAQPDVVAQETAMAQAEQALPGLRKQLAQQMDLIADLTGQFPGQTAAPDLTLSSIELPVDLPLSLPARLVDQRPDIRAAAANLQAASAQVGVAIAARLPNISLTANAGGEATRFGQVFSAGNGFWLLGGTIAQPVFDAGDLLHKQRGAEAGLDQAKAQYQSTVLSAFQNVADSLEAIQTDAVALASAATAETTAARSLSIAKTQFAAGEVGSLTVLNAEAAYQQVRLARVQAQAARYADAAALFQSLGGGWWNRTETADVR